MEKEGVSRGRVWMMMGKEPYLRGMWEHLPSGRSMTKKFRQLADKERQAGIQGHLQGKDERLRQGVRQDKKRRSTW